ncbi:MAG TPA: hypothetical protein VFX48_00990 [Saprospiraceae bacterium]|nr:hypothetical protein [Saprospiraceae bacterium]
MMDLLSFPDQARIWVYAADQPIPEEQVPVVYQAILDFTAEWSSHQKALRATGGLLHRRFLVLVVDADFNTPGGCSIDVSVHFVKHLGKELGIDFFDRNLFYYIDQEEVLPIRKDQMGEALEQGRIHPETLFFDTLVSQKAAFQKEWLKPLKDSWHYRLL